MTKNMLFLMCCMVGMVAVPSFANYNPDTVYSNSCSVNMFGGNGTGAVNAVPVFNRNSYSCDAGEYLPAGQNWENDDSGCISCPANSYCEGGEFDYSYDSADGVVTCASQSSIFTQSDAESTSVEACYAAVSCPTITENANCDPHATSCAYDTGAGGSGRFYQDETSSVKCALTFACDNGYEYTSNTVPTTLPSRSTNGSTGQYRSHLYPDGGENSNSSNDLLAGEWKVTWTGSKAGVMRGISSCNSVPGNSDAGAWDNNKSNWTLPANTNLVNNSADSSDASRYFCWCKPTSWTTVSGDTTNLSAPWVFHSSSYDAAGCASECSKVCSNEVRNIAEFRAAIFTAMGDSKQCVPNTIMLTWLNANGGTHESNTCKYGENLQTPASPLTKRGFTFKGWRFVPQQSQNPEQE